MNNIFDDEDNDDNRMNIKLLDIINKMFNSIFIKNLGVIKIDRNLMELVDKYNVIQKKKNMKDKNNNDDKKHKNDNICDDSTSDNSDINSDK